MVQRNQSYFRRRHLNGNISTELSHPQFCRTENPVREVEDGEMEKVACRVVDERSEGKSGAHPNFSG
jgi:hypothetical protein